MSLAGLWKKKIGILPKFTLRIFFWVLFFSVAGIIQTENNLEVENQNQKQNNEVVNRTDQNPVQRNTENKRDEQPILELNVHNASISMDVVSPWFNYIFN